MRKVVEGMRSVVGRSERRLNERVGGEDGAGDDDNDERVDVGAEVGPEGVGRVSAGALVLLRRHLTGLEEVLQKDSGEAMATTSARVEE